MAPATLPVPLSDPTERRWFLYPEEFSVEYERAVNDRGDPLFTTKQFATFEAARKFQRRHRGRIYRQTDIRPDPDFPKGIAYTSQEVILVDWD